MSPVVHEVKEKPWRGVKWNPVSRGACVKHGTPVGPITRLCITCHQEQLEAARKGSREWEL